MDESTALDVVAVRSVEICDGDRVLWSDTERDWATRAAAESVGESADGETFLVRRAQLALHRIGTSYPSVSHAVRALRWRPWTGVAIVAGAFVLGVAVDRIGGAGRVNPLAPPVYALILWNLLVYATLAVRLVVFRGGRGAGPLRALLMRAAGGIGRAARADGDDALRLSLTTLSSEWARLAAPLYSARAARILHIAAAALGLGVIGGMYLRGLVFEYRATWESTFLNAGEVRTLVAMALSPGSLLTGVAVPDVAAIAAIRAPASENAASWLHLLAGSVAAVVVIPRLLLAAGAGLVERRRATHLAVPLSEPYFRRLLHGFAGEPARLRVIPYSYTPDAAAMAGLKAIVARVLGDGATLAVDAPTAWGDEEATASLAIPERQSDPVAALFSLTATPEADVHGTFVSALTERAGAARPVLVLIDESAFRARWPEDQSRLSQRRQAWVDLLAETRLTPVFLNLVAPDLPAAEAALEAALAAPRAGGPSPGVSL